MVTEAFHLMPAGTSYKLEITSSGILTKVSITAKGRGLRVYDSPGQPVQLDDLEVNIGASLCGKGSNNPELRAILSRVQKGGAA